MTYEESTLLAYWVNKMVLLANTEKRYVAVCLSTFIKYAGSPMNKHTFINMCMLGSVEKPEVFERKRKTEAQDTSPPKKKKRRKKKGVLL